MPTKDPTLWALLLLWIGDNWPTLYGMLLTIAIAWVCITYQGGTGRRRLLEALLCGLLWLPACSLLAWSGAPEQIAGMLASMVGFIGVEAIRDAALRLISNKTGGA